MPAIDTGSVVKQVTQQRQVDSPVAAFCQANEIGAVLGLKFFDATTDSAGAFVEAGRSFVRQEDRLRENLRSHAPDLTQLLVSISDHWGYEDPIYRLYHQSFKIYRLGQATEKIVAALRRCFKS